MKILHKNFLFYFISVVFLFCLLGVISPFPLMANDKIHPLVEKVSAKTNQGDCLKQGNNFDESLKLYPNDFLAISNRGNCLLALGFPQSAIDYYSKALDLQPLNPDIHLNRGIAEEQLYRWDAAQADYDWILDRYPKNSDALYNLAHVKGSKGDWKEAKNLYEKALLARPEFPIAQSSKALIEYQLGDLDTAESDLRLIIRRHPMFADARAALSALLFIKGSKGEAQSHWAAVAGLEPHYKDRKWIENIRRWPPAAVNDLMNFLALDNL